MLKQLTEILREKYPHLLIEHSKVLDHITIYHVEADFYCWVLQICKEEIRHTTGIACTTPADPDYFQILDGLIRKRLLEQDAYTPSMRRTHLNK